MDECKPLPSSTLNARTTNVNSAGKRKGWSDDTTSKSSPMLDKISLRLAAFSSLVRCALNSDSYSSLFQGLTLVHFSAQLELTLPL